jgi:hypothetical protein
MSFQEKKYWRGLNLYMKNGFWCASVFCRNKDRISGNLFIAIAASLD